MLWLIASGEGNRCLKRVSTIMKIDEATERGPSL